MQQEQLTKVCMSCGSENLNNYAGGAGSLSPPTCRYCGYVGAIEVTRQAQNEIRKKFLENPRKSQMDPATMKILTLGIIALFVLLVALVGFSII